MTVSKEMSVCIMIALLPEDIGMLRELSNSISLSIHLRALLFLRMVLLERRSGR